MSTIVTTPNPPAVAPTTPPPAAASPQPVIEQLEGAQLTRNPDNTIKVELVTGEVFTGAVDDVVKKLAKSQADTHKYASGLKEELKAAKQPPPAPAAAATPEEIQLRTYLVGELAKALGLNSGDELVQNFQKIYNVTTNAGAQMAAAAFYAQNPDFPTSEQNIEKMFGVLEKIGGDAENVNHLSAAHAVCLKTGVYKGLTPEEIQKVTNQNPQAPPPMITPSSVETNVQSGLQEVNINMTQEQILAAIKANKAAAKP